MFSSPLEFLAGKYENVVRYDATGNVAGIFVKFPKMKSSELDASLPEHTHPAFIVNDVEQDYILLGKYKCGENGVANGALVSLPNIAPYSRGSYSTDMEHRRIREAGGGISCMTIADYGFLKLLAQKHGWKPHGQTSVSGARVQDGVWWGDKSVYTAGEKCVFRAWEYVCIENHTATSQSRPDISPALWERTRFVGGVPASGDDESVLSTLNGSGPLDWYLGGDAGGIADIVSGDLEWQHGCVVRAMEILVLPDNDAAELGAYSAIISDDTPWKAILPNEDDDGYTLVAPGTSGTLHWNWDGTKIVLDTQWDGYVSTGNGERVQFSELTCNSTRLPYVPCIMKELGLYPTGAGDDTRGSLSVFFSAEDMSVTRGGSRYDNFEGTDSEGLGNVRIERTSDAEYRHYRPRALAPEND